jgi:hypothetical protein
MTELKTRDIPLNWDVFVTPGIPTVTSDLPPGTKQGMWSPISSTLIYGKRDAVLVDLPVTVEQADALADWVEASGKNLTKIYATHGHGDHFFGASTVLQRFWHRLGLNAEPSMLCGALANILTWAAAGSHRRVIGAESMFAKTGKHTLGWQTYSGDGGTALGRVRGVFAAPFLGCPAAESRTAK